MICVNPVFGRSFRPKRQDARTCCPRCRKAVFRQQIAAPDSVVTHPGYPTTSPGPVTLNRADPPDAVLADENVIPLGPLHGDTISDRRWRIVRAADALTLECEAMVAGGWKAVATKPIMLELRRFDTWLGLTMPAGGVPA